MDYVEGRGVTSGNDVYFIYDAENEVVVVRTYRDAPGVRSDRLMPNVVKTFSKDEWIDINKFLSAGAADRDEDEFEGEGVSSDDIIKIDSSGNVHPPEATKVLAEIQQLRKEGSLPKINNAKAILPGKGLPAMTKDKVQEKFDPITGTQNEEKEENGKE